MKDSGTCSCSPMMPSCKLPIRLKTNRKQGIAELTIAPRYMRTSGLILVDTLKDYSTKL